MALEIDVINKAQHETCLTAIVKRFGGLDILINGAGINAPTPFMEISIEEYLQS